MYKKGDKTAFRQSTTSTFREKPSENPEAVRKGAPNMQQDYSRQRAVAPTSLAANTEGTHTTNAGGRPKAI